MFPLPDGRSMSNVNQYSSGPKDQETVGVVRVPVEAPLGVIGPRRDLDGETLQQLEVPEALRADASDSGEHVVSFPLHLREQIVELLFLPLELLLDLEDPGRPLDAVWCAAAVDEPSLNGRRRRLYSLLGEDLPRRVS